jgi:hypothetical protein
LIVDETLTEEDAELELKKTKKDLEEVYTELLSKKTELETLANTEVPEEVLERISYTFDCLKGKYGEDISQWEFSIKRLLVEWFFGLSDKHGVWITGSDGEVLYTIKSNLGTLAFGWLGDDTDAGVVGQNMMNEQVEATLSQFASIVSALGEPYTRTCVDVHQHRQHGPSAGVVGLRRSGAASGSAIVHH